MKLLVTGREGQLARSLVERAAHHPGIEIIAIGRPELDLEVPGAAEAIIKSVAPDIVINAAAYTAVDRAEDEPERAMRINGDGAGEVAAAARALGAPVIQVSTDYVFDGTSDEPYTEDAATNPLNVYGRSKLAGEELVRAANPDHLILRTAWVYSPFGNNFVKTMMRLAETRDTVSVVADQTGNPTSALDLADAMLKAVRATSDDEGIGLGRTYHLAGTGSAGWFDVAVAVFDECKRLGLPTAEVQPTTSERWPTKAPRPANSRLDSARFERDFRHDMSGWRRSLAAVIRRLASSDDLPDVHL
ncbi:MAG: dTDP-4-dehydrorhamnose reductase [Alphaproteobacteria bacterium]|nr:dTDP-4-dehydrorhamnose reductase [Alphaproteobacteria bacterium]